MRYGFFPFFCFERKKMMTETFVCWLHNLNYVPKRKMDGKSRKRTIFRDSFNKHKINSFHHIHAYESKCIEKIHKAISCKQFKNPFQKTHLHMSAHISENPHFIAVQIQTLACYAKMKWKKNIHGVCTKNKERSNPKSRVTNVKAKIVKIHTERERAGKRERDRDTDGEKLETTLSLAWNYSRPKTDRGAHTHTHPENSIILHLTLLNLLHFNGITLVFFVARLPIRTHILSKLRRALCVRARLSALSRVNNVYCWSCVSFQSYLFFS